jgi:tRNA-specific adenosine deaminase 3
MTWSESANTINNQPWCNKWLNISYYSLYQLYQLLQDMPFTEILPELLSKHNQSQKETIENESVKDDDSKDDDLFVEAFAVQVEPKMCGPLIRQLQNHQDMELQHLKRVKCVPLISRQNGDVLKRQKVSEHRLVLIGTIHSDCQSIIESFSQQYTVLRVRVPRRPPNTEYEWNRMNELWPTKKVSYLAIEQEQQARRISPDDMSLMEKTIRQIILEKDTLLLDPESGNMVGKASVERRLQQSSTTNTINNPLQTDIIYAIQNVSRRERTQSAGSYLCTGFDLYTFQEPSLFEGMAALHSRVRRILFVNKSPQLGALTNYSLHTLSSTNHHFRAFQWNESVTEEEKGSENAIAGTD